MILTRSHLLLHRSNTSFGHTAQFAGSCIGVILIVMALEFIRRSQREYDRYIIRQWRQSQKQTSSPSSISAAENGPTKTQITTATEVQQTNSWISPLTFRPSLLQQAIRSAFYMVQFGLAYLVMLLAMYYNGESVPCSVPLR